MTRSPKPTFEQLITSVVNKMTEETNQPRARIELIARHYSQLFGQESAYPCEWPELYEIHHETLCAVILGYLEGDE